MNTEVKLTSDLARAARALTKVSTSIIAQSAGLTKAQVRDFEKGVTDIPDEAKTKLVASLEKYGALFIAEEEDAGYGVRRRYTREKFMRLNTWEGEGGQA